MKDIWTNMGLVSMSTKTISSKTVSKHLAPTSSNNTLHKVTDEITRISCGINVCIIRMVTWHTKELNCDIRYTTLVCKRSLLGPVSTDFISRKRIRISSAEIVNIQIFKYLNETGKTSVTQIWIEGKKLERMRKESVWMYSDIYLPRIRKVTKHLRQRSGFWTPIPKRGSSTSSKIARDSQITDNRLWRKNKNLFPIC
jgi:hypothetical protein